MAALILPDKFYFAFPVLHGAFFGMFEILLCF